MPADWQNIYPAYGKPGTSSVTIWSNLYQIVFAKALRNKPNIMSAIQATSIGGDD
jgi:hypothetical protein